MDCSGIHNLMDDYLDNLLSDKTRKEFEESIEYCPEEKTLLLKQRQLKKRLNDLPLSFTPPESIFNELKNSLLEIDTTEINSTANFSKPTSLTDDDVQQESDSGEKRSAKKKKYKTSRATNLFWTTLSILIISVIIGYYYIYVYNNTAPWKFNLLGGTATINQNFSERSNIYSGDNIILSEVAHAKMALPARFELELFGNSKITILDTRATSNKINLIDGSFNFNSLNSESNFIVQRGNFTIEEKSGQYAFTMDEYGNINLSVDKGVIELNHSNFNFRVASKYSLSIIEDSYCTIPLHENATYNFKHSIDRLNSNVNDIAALSTAMLESKQTDQLTLLRIMELVAIDKRELLYQKISNIFPPPSGVTKQGILESNKRMLEKWWSEIETQI